MQTLKLQVSLMRLFGCVKAAFANLLACDHQLHSPFSLVRGNAQKTRPISFSWLTHVLQVAKTRYFSEIFKSIVSFISVDMVYVRTRQFASHIQPRQPMRQFLLVVDRNSPVSSVGWTACTFTDKIRAAGVRFPNELACFRVVAKNGSDMVNSNHEYQFTIGVTK